MKKKSQVEFGPEVPGYAVLNEQLRTKGASVKRSPKVKTSIKGAKPVDATKPK